MKSKIFNQTLPSGWYFDLEQSPVFIGTTETVLVTDANELLAGPISAIFTRCDLFLVAKKSKWVKRFLNPSQNLQLCVQISPNEAIFWLIENGYLENAERFSLPDLLDQAVKLKCNDFPRTISIKPMGTPKDPPSAFMPGEKVENFNWNDYFKE